MAETPSGSEEGRHDAIPPTHVLVPRGQGRNQADAMDQCLIDLMDRGE